MRNILRVVIPVFLLLRFADLHAQAGYANIITDSAVNVPCGQTCTNLTATALGGSLTNSYTVSQISYLPPFPFNSGTNVLVHTDDLWTGVIPLPFNFCFFGNLFSSIIVGSNGEISFNTQSANGTDNWDIPGPIPFNSLADQFNTIMAPWQDLDPTNRGNIYYNIGGVAPNRYFEVSWYQSGMYGDPNSFTPGDCNTAYSQTQMAVIYETSNIIEVYIQQKGAPCTGWNGGNAIEGIMNGNGTAAYFVPGRNATQWGPVSNDAWRFTPAGTSTATLNWYLEPANTLVGTGNTVNVCPPAAGSNHYLVTATYSACGNGTTTISKNVFVGLSNLTVADSAVQPGCSGGTGSVFATFNSTTGILNYGWNTPGGAGQTSVTGLGPGTYIFTATDSIGCVARDTEVLTGSGPLIVNVANDTATSCTGTTNNGILNATITGGVAPFSYAWTGGATANPITGLNVGTYCVTVTDHNGCSGTACANVSVLTHALTFASPQITNVTCNGGNNGRIIAPVNGGTNPITFTWSSGSSTTDTLSNLIAGTYGVTAVDANGCSATASFTVTQPLTALSVTVPNDTVSSCSGQTNIGALTANVTGGTPVYSYTWSNLATTNPVTGLVAGTYNVTVRDVFGCSAISSGTVVTNISSLAVTIQVANPICATLKGQVVATETGGIVPITYHWSTGITDVTSLTSDTLSGVAGGTFTITVTDANGCSVTSSFAVNQPTPFSVNVPDDTITSCSGTTTNGVLTATGTGGSPNYTYLWSNTLTTNPITGLSAGTYTVTATDRLGCTAIGSGSVVVVGSPVVFNNAQLTSPACASANNGEIILSTSGGTSPITFTWSGGSTQNDTIVGLAGGTYVITATDVNGCSATASYTLTQPAPIVFGTPVIIGVGCNGGTGSITASATGGTGTITYGWSGGTIGATVTGPAGGYVVTATDGNGCTATAAYSINQAAPVAIDSADVVAASCSSDSGSISVTATGGTGTLTYTWNPGNLSGSNLINLNPGGYTLTVTDINGCSATAYYIVGHSSCGGCPAVNTNNNVIIPCSDTCTQLTATAFSAARTTAYTVGPIPYAPPFAFNTGTIVLNHVDDKWASPAITIPFNFCFWGVSYNKIVIGSNGEISFNPAEANNGGATENWSIPGPIPNINLQNDQLHTIMAPWQDLDPTNRGNIYYNISGTTPCRKFEVSWYDCNMFGDSGSVENNYCSRSDHQTAMVVLYETTNAIDIYIQNKQVACNNGGLGYWNGGWAIEGIVGTANQVVTVPGRNATQWSAQNDAYRFTPSGAPNYTVQWFQNGNVIANTPTVTVCPPVPTTYTVQATYTNCDNSQVIVADSVYVTPGGTLTSAIDSVHTLVCNGDSDGAVYASYNTIGTVTSFGWNYPGGANQTSLVGIPAGTYIFTVTTTTCSSSDTVVLVNPAKIVIALANDTFNSCTLNNLGALSATASGGTPGYTYLWSNSQTTASLTGLTPGTYSLTVTDSHGCTASATATVTRIQGNLAFTTPVVVNATCNAGGSITIGTTGGTAPVTYTWNPSEPNTTTLTNLTAGTYCVTATDAGGCSVTACFTITAPAPVTIDSSRVTNLTCNGAGNGSIIVHASGGSGTLTYTWSPSEPNTNSLTGLAAGTYNLTVADPNGCSATASYTITQPSAIANDSVVIVDVSCNTSGSILVVDTGGVAPLSYQWSITGQITDSLTNLQPGTYTLTVTDAHGCSITASYTVGTAPGALVFGAPVITEPSCNGGSNGSITVSATGGTGTITYAWGPPGGTGATLSGLPAGTYTVTATDGGGCSVSASYTIGQPAVLGFGNPIITPPSCNAGSDGSISATVTGGTPGYTYSWTGGSTANPVTGLSAGVYCVTVTDANSCSASICYSVSQPTPVVIDSATINAVTCVNPGQIILGVSGGTPGYTFSWSAGATGGDTASVSAAGTVTVTVTDSHGCSATGSFTVGAAAGAVIIDSSHVSPITCNGNINGSITVFASDSAGGPITYLWGNGATTNGISNLAAATYCVTATDSLGCTASACYTISQPAAITFNAPVIVSPLCNSDTTGSITVSATGGTGTITYAWPDLTVGAKDSDLTAGTYVVTATDSLGCSATASYTVTEPTAVTVNGTVDSITCNGAANGSITAAGNGGTGAFTYVWTGGATGATLPNLGPGTYCVTATDANGCSASTCFTLSQPPVLVIDTAVISKATCLVGGSVVVTASGGTPGYTYGWSSNASVTDSAGNIAPGSITVTVTDSRGCTVTGTYTVPADTNLVVIDSAHIVNDVCHGGNIGSIVVTATGGTGSLNYAWSSPPGGSTNTLSGLAAGSYTITVTDSLGCSASATYAITQPTAIVVIVDSTQVTCTSLGSVFTHPTGGTGTFTYQWGAPLNSTSDSVGGLNNGTYCVTVTDQNACTASACGTVVTAPNSIALSFDSVRPTCHGLSNGSVTVTATGTVGTVIYAWGSPPGGNTNTISNVPAGTYCVTVTDGNGCSKSACSTLGQPDSLEITGYTVVRATCTTTGSLAVVTSGGTPTNTYQWTGTVSGTTNPLTGLNGGSIESVVVTDHNGCTVAGEDSLPAAPQPLTIADSVITNNVCHGVSNGGIALHITGGDGTALSFQWSPTEANDSTITGLGAGNYSVTITQTDGDGCSVSGTFTITQPVAFTVAASATPLVCPGASDNASVTVTTGGAPGFTYQWSAGGGTNQTDVITGLTTTPVTVSVTVTDANLCTATASVTVAAEKQITADTSGIVFLPCQGGSNVVITGQFGSGPLTYTLTPPGTTNTTGQFGVVGSGNYTYTISDSICSITGTFFVPEAIPAPLDSTSSDSTSCFGFNDGSLTVFITGDSLVNAPFTYSVNGGAFQSSNVFDSLGAGSYQVVVKTSGGCLDTIQTPVSVGQPLQIQVSFTPDTIQGYANTAVLLAPNVVNAVNPVYSWNPTKGLNCDNCASDSATITAPQWFYVTVSDSANPKCAVTDSVLILLQGPLIMPNAFAPGGTNPSDAFFGPVSVTYVIVKEFHIYNRWGQLVHNSTDPWDGKFNGKEQPAGTYIYYIQGQYEDPANAGHYLTGKAEGSVTLLR